MEQWIERLARLGYAAIGVVYAIVGLLAATGSSADQKGAYFTILRQPFGKAILGIIAIGLAGYVVWRIVSGITDSEHRGNDPKGIALRAGSIGRGLIYAAISTEVVRVMTAHATGPGSESKAKHWTARLMDLPFGRWLVLLAGLGVAGYGAYQLRGKISSQVRGGLSPKLVAVSRFGIAARGVVFLIIGGSIGLAAWRHDPSRAHGTSGALHQLAEPLGGALLIVAGIGLIAYGIYCWINARYRRIAAR